MYRELLDFYKDKSVFITGHTGFKGSWMCRVLAEMGAQVSGYSLEPPTNPSLFYEAGIERDVRSFIGDIRDFDYLKGAFNEAKPEIVIHMAAQPIVRDSYKDPRYTYETNVMGTVNILESIREYNSIQESRDINTSGVNVCLAESSKGNYVRSFLNVTTDKVYLNREWERGYVEEDELDGYDPYSNSKSCSELVTHAYKRSFFNTQKNSLADDENQKYTAISTARAGNVIGGGDFANDRIIPDCVRAAIKGDDIIIRNPNSVRPFQHVLEPVFAYLMIAQKQYEDRSFEGYYNAGPDVEDCISAGEMADLFVKYWGDGIKWINKSDGGPHEANFLHLDCSKLKSVFDWTPRWNVETAVKNTVKWYKAWNEGTNIRNMMTEQIYDFIGSDGGL